MALLRGRLIISLLLGYSEVLGIWLREHCGIWWWNYEVDGKLYINGNGGLYFISQFTVLCVLYVT